jgi:HD-GYP domain-containing protein (c-di-GMP phosphodiesterase class II)
MQTTEGTIRAGGHDFLFAFYTALGSVKLYPGQNEQVHKAIETLGGLADAVCLSEGELEMRIAGEYLYINAVRLRFDLDNYAVFFHVLTTLRRCGIGTLSCTRGVEDAEWHALLTHLVAFSERDSVPDLAGLWDQLAQAGVTHLDLQPPPAHDAPPANSQEAKAVAKRTYERCIAVTRDVMAAVRGGRTISVKKVKRAVQTTVDQVAKNEQAIIGMTTVREWDELGAIHAANVCVLSIAIGKRIGLTKLQLYDLGFTALLHDLGKSRIPFEALEKAERGETAHRTTTETHPWQGVLGLFGLRGYGAIPYRGMIVSYEHHLRPDLSGFPMILEPRRLSLYSRIVSVANHYDAATSHAGTTSRPDELLQELIKDDEGAYDTTVVKAFVNLMGVYPVGTCVILDTYDVGLVHAPGTDPNHIDRPLVRVLCSADGDRKDALLDLTAKDKAGHFEHSVLKATDPAEYGIVPYDYFI